MPGSALNSALAYLRPDGSLHIGMYVMRGADVVEQNMDRAIERIRAREPGGVVVWVHGYNVDVLRKAFAPPTSPLEAAGWTSDCE